MFKNIYYMYYSLIKINGSAKLSTFIKYFKKNGICSINMKFLVQSPLNVTYKWLILIDSCRRWKEGGGGQEDAAWRTTWGQLPNPKVHCSTSHWGMSEVKVKPLTKVECRRS